MPHATLHYTCVWHCALAFFCHIEQWALGWHSALFIYCMHVCVFLFYLSEANSDWRNAFKYIESPPTVGEEGVRNLHDDWLQPIIWMLPYRCQQLTCILTYRTISPSVAQTHVHTGKWHRDDLKYRTYVPGQQAPMGGSMPGINIQTGPTQQQAVHGDDCSQDKFIATHLSPEGLFLLIHHHP